MKLALGTVQFGMNYGIASAGRPDIDSIKDILQKAFEENIDILDTSSGYGDAEEILGKVICRLNEPFRIVSKYPQGDHNVETIFNVTLRHLGVSKLYGYLLHHFEVYRENPSVWEDFEKLKQNGKVEKIGFSIYSPEELELLLNRNVDFDLIQFPYNIFDRQFEPYLQLLKEKNVEVHTRSVFLQGLFFKDIKLLPSKLLPLGGYLSELHQYCAIHNISIEQLALNYVLNEDKIDRVLIGIDNLEQLKANLYTAGQNISETDISFINSINIKEKKLLNPANWK